MKLSLSDVRPVPIDLIGVKEIHPRKAKSPKPAPGASHRAYNNQPGKNGARGNLRTVCFLLLGAAAVATFVTNQYQVRTEATIMAQHLEAQLRTLGASGTIHSNTVSYEQEVNRVTDKN